MSLKAFHILFVIASTLLTVGFGVWSLREYMAGEGTTANLVMGISSMVLSVVLIWYGRYVLRKLRHISYL
jgi:hypothetical protein